ncbi:DUF4017 domain-containing protein [Sutcliffiella horikoshii]|uniref:DUF4017 domain-containing protein n=1 Tax=Sutcliffiella horikoshii TaxID=79883 RepID=A0AA94WQ73_9BACI|nr:DUF4017 family protein [Sutcliffiella horikoshii]TYS58978.1 DUF4017 domain-containing protein [Sutcliffiella horikoshii]
MKILIPPLLAYLIVCILAVLAPATEGYFTLGQKLLIGQIFAIPALILITLISFLINKKLSRN